MERIEILETLSDKIRSGEPVGFLEAIACIEYQARRREHERQNVWWRKAFRRLRRALATEDRADG